MVICKDGCYAYSGVNAGDAYQNYLNADDDHNQLSPSALEWYSATEMKLNMALAPMPKTKAGNAA